MTIVETIKAYGKIIELVSSNISYDSEAIMDRIKMDLNIPISLRSLQRRLKELREEFHIDIQYNQHSAMKSGGFEIRLDEEDYNLGNSSLIDKLSKSLTAFNNYKELKLNNNFVQISSESSAINSSHFQKAMRAIKSKRVLEIEYKKPLNMFIYKTNKDLRLNIGKYSYRSLEPEIFFKSFEKWKKGKNISGKTKNKIYWNHFDKEAYPITDIFNGENWDFWNKTNMGEIFITDDKDFDFVKFERKVTIEYAEKYLTKELNKLKNKYKLSEKM